jgi:hypothetical protein
MQAHIAQECQQINFVNILNRMLELAMQTAEAASEEKNHRLVLQAVREVTRLVTLINKISGSQDQKPKPKEKSSFGSSPKKELSPRNDIWEKSGKIEEKIGVLERFFKNNLPVSSCQKNIGDSGPADSDRNKAKRQDQAAGASRRQVAPVALAAAGAEPA